MTYDFIPTTSGIADIQTQYTTDGVNWTNIGPVQVATSSTTWDNGITVDLSGITSVNNDSSFGVRLVSAYAPGTSTYETATGGTISNTAGNVRFNNIAFSGTLIAGVPFDFNPGFGLLLGVPLFVGLRATKKRLA